MNKEDYNKYYIQGSDHYLIPKDVFIELFNEMINWKEESQKQKDNWNKLKEHLKNRYDNGTESISYRQVFMEIREAMQELEQGSDRK